MNPRSTLTLFLDDLWISPYTYSVFCALKEKGISFKIHEVHFEKGEALNPEFRGKTFTDLIPALKTDEVIISESLAILEFLEEAYPQKTKLLPANIQDRANARALLSWYRCGMTALRSERSMETAYYENQRAQNPLSPTAQSELEDLKKAIRTYLKPGNDFLFKHWCIVDSETAMMLNRLIQNRDPLEEDLKAYAKKILDRPASREYLSRVRRPFVSYYAD